MSASSNNDHHPLPDLLEAWAFGLPLEPAVKAELEQHFEGCAECRQLAADLRGFEQLGAAAVSSDHEVAASLGRLRQRILAEELAAGGVVTSGGLDGVAPDPFDPAEEAVDKTAVVVPLVRPSRPAAWQWAAAAAILLAAGAAIERHREIGRLGSQLEELRQLALKPLANTTIAVVRPLDDPERGPPSGDSVRGGVAVVVRGADPLPEGSWRVEIADAAGRRELEVAGLRSVAGELRFFLPPGALPAGNHQLRLYHGENELWPQVFGLTLPDG